MSSDCRLPVRRKPTWQSSGKRDPLYRHATTVGHSSDGSPAQRVANTRPPQGSLYTFLCPAWLLVDLWNADTTNEPNIVIV